MSVSVRNISFNQNAIDLLCDTESESNALCLNLQPGYKNIDWILFTMWLWILCSQVDCEYFVHKLPAWSQKYWKLTQNQSVQNTLMWPWFGRHIAACITLTLANINQRTCSSSTLSVKWFASSSADQGILNHLFEPSLVWFGLAKTHCGQLWYAPSQASQPGRPGSVSMCSTQVGGGRCWGGGEEGEEERETRSFLTVKSTDYVLITTYWPQ